MKILFDKENGGNGEMQEILGFTDADITVSDLWPYLRTATREVYEIIGKDNYKTCESVSSKDEGGEEAIELYDLVRYAIVFNAFRKYAPLNDLAFTTDGRLFRRDDHQAAAFEWQISNSDDAMERRYYESIDEIISFIMDSDVLEPSEFMTEFSGLYVPNLKVFQRFVNINNSHLLYFKLAPSLRLCEQQEIINRMGMRFEDYKALEKKNDYITNLIQNCCVCFAMMDGIQKFSTQLFPEGLLKVEKNNKKHANGYDKESTTLYYRNQLERLLKDLEIEMQRLKPTVSRSQIKFSKEDGYIST